MRVDTWSFGILNPLSLSDWINELLNEVSVLSYFGRFPEKDDNVPPTRKAKPENINTKPKITVITATDLGTFLFSSQEIGCAQIILINNASKRGVILYTSDAA